MIATSIPKGGTVHTFKNTVPNEKSTTQATGSAHVSHTYIRGGETNHALMVTSTSEIVVKCMRPTRAAVLTQITQTTSLCALVTELVSQIQTRAVNAISEPTDHFVNTLSVPTNVCTEFVSTGFVYAAPFGMGLLVPNTCVKTVVIRRPIAKHAHVYPDGKESYANSPRVRLTNMGVNVETREFA